jgi:ABC-type Fe3+-hydroxamate transport system substrate-binding protein
MTAFKPLLVIAVFALFIVSCEQQAAEMNFRTTLGGVTKGSTAMIINSKGLQILEVSTDISGNGYINEIKPGTYTVKFKDATGNMYPAVRTVTLAPGDTQTLIVELNDVAEAGAPAAGAPADSSGGSSGE